MDLHADFDYFSGEGRFIGINVVSIIPSNGMISQRVADAHHTNFAFGRRFPLNYTTGWRGKGLFTNQFYRKDIKQRRVKRSYNAQTFDFYHIYFCVFINHKW